MGIGAEIESRVKRGECITAAIMNSTENETKWMEMNEFEKKGRDGNKGMDDIEVRRHGFSHQKNGRGMGLTISSKQLSLDMTYSTTIVDSSTVRRGSTDVHLY